MPDTPFQRLNRPSVSSSRLAHAPVHRRLTAAAARPRPLQLGITRRRIAKSI